MRARETNGLISSSGCQSPQLTASAKLDTRVQTEKKRREDAVSGKWKPRFYGGSLLKMPIAGSDVRGLSPKAVVVEETTLKRGPLCVCASLRFFERGTLEGRIQGWSRRVLGPAGERTLVWPVSSLR